MSDPVSALTIGGSLTHAAEEFPDEVALIEGVADTDRRRWTYAELFNDARAAAGELLQYCGPGDRVAICAPNMPEWLMLYFGVALAGAVIVGVNPSATPAELRFLLEQSQARVLATVSSYRNNDLRGPASALLAEVSSLEHVMDIDGWQPSASYAPARLPSVLPDDPALIQYTSGTTGQSKGAVMTHGGLISNSATAMRYLGLKNRPVLLNVMPMYHVAGSENNTLGILSMRGAQIVQRWDAGLALQLMEEEQVSYFTAVPTMYIAMMEHADFEKRKRPALEYATTGGTTVSPELFRRAEAAFGIDCGVIFGQTEAGGVVAMSSRGDGVAEKTQTVGRVIPGMTVKIVDPVSTDEVGFGDVGEIWVRSPANMLGYFRDPEMTAATLTPDGWVRTGDLGTLSESGYIQITGRLKDMIIRGGENIYAREIEDCLMEHSEVAETAVIGVPDARLGEEIAAFVRAVPGAILTAEGLSEYARAHLTRQKVPRYWRFVDALPMTPNGKIKKYELRARFAAS